MEVRLDASVASRAKVLFGFIAHLTEGNSKPVSCVVIEMPLI